MDGEAVVGVKTTNTDGVQMVIKARPPFSAPVVTAILRNW